MPEQYTLYVDESGEEGVSTIRTATTPGASPWMAFGACLIKDSDAPAIRNVISELETELNIPSGLHFKNLNHKRTEEGLAPVIARRATARRGNPATISRLLRSARNDGTWLLSPRKRGSLESTKSPPFSRGIQKMNRGNRFRHCPATPFALSCVTSNIMRLR